MKTLQEEYLLELRTNSHRNFIKLISLKIKIEELYKELLNISEYKIKLLEKIEFSTIKKIKDIEDFIRIKENELESDDVPKNKNTKLQKYK